MGVLSLREFITPPGGGPPPHVHEDVDETFYGLEGSYEIRLGDRSYAAGPGTVAFGPPGIGPGFRNTSAGTSRMLCVATPGGAERTFEELAELVSAEGRPAARRAG
jgi:quercetin dioxygenase-like cupin family protein